MYFQLLPIDTTIASPQKAFNRRLPFPFDFQETLTPLIDVSKLHCLTLTNSAIHLELFHALPSQFIALFTPPLPQILALRAWKDVYEKRENDHLFSLFDVEKGLRMFLHASPLLYDYFVLTAKNLPNPTPLDRSFPLEILNWTLNQRHVESLIACSLLTNSNLTFDENPLEYLLRLRRTLQARSLCEGLVGSKLVDFMEYYSPSFSKELSTLTKTEILSIFQELIDKSRQTIDQHLPDLPKTPSNYDALSDWLVSVRMNEKIS